MLYSARVITPLPGHRIRDDGPTGSAKRTVGQFAPQLLCELPPSPVRRPIGSWIRIDFRSRTVGIADSLIDHWLNVGVSQRSRSVVSLRLFEWIAGHIVGHIVAADFNETKANSALR
jgi:hypothetical protein